VVRRRVARGAGLKCDVAHTDLSRLGI
jgi:hypothetical protein